MGNGNDAYYERELENKGEDQYSSLRSATEGYTPPTPKPASHPLYPEEEGGSYKREKFKTVETVDKPADDNTYGVPQQRPQIKPEDKLIDLESSQSATSVTRGTPVDAAYSEGMRQINVRKEKQLLAQGEAERKRAVEEVDIRAEQIRKTDELREATQRQQNMINQRIQLWEDRQALAMKERAQMVVDPNRLWNNASAGSKLAAGLTVLIGGFLEGYTGGKIKETASAYIKTAVDKDIEAQKNAIAGKTAEAAAATNTLGYLIKKLGSTATGEANARKMIEDTARIKLAEAVATSKKAIARINAKLIIEGLNEMQAKAKHEMTNAAIDQIRSSSSESKSKTFDPYALAEAKAQGKGPGKVPDKLIAQFTAIEGLQKEILEYRKQYRKLGVTGKLWRPPVGDTQWNRVMSMKQALEENLATVQAGGSPSVEYIKVYKGYAGPKGYLTDNQVDARLRNIVHLIKEKQKTLRAQYGKQYNLAPWEKRQDQLNFRLDKAVKSGKGTGH